MKVAIPRFGDEVAPCFEYSATITIYLLKSGKLLDKIDFEVQSSDAFDRVRLLRDQSVDTLICGGVQDDFEDMVRTSGIRVISWVSGNVENILDRFISGQLVAGTGRLGRNTDDTQSIGG